MAFSTAIMTKTYPANITCSQVAKALGFTKFSRNNVQDYLNDSFGGDWRKALMFREGQRFFNTVQTRELIRVLNLKPEDFR